MKGGNTEMVIRYIRRVSAILAIALNRPNSKKKKLNYYIFSERQFGVE